MEFEYAPVNPPNTMFDILALPSRFVFEGNENVNTSCCDAPRLLEVAML